RDLIDGVYSEKTGRDAERLGAASGAAVEELALSEKDLAREIKRLEKQMLDHARNLEFEQAARTRDQLALLKSRVFGAAGEGSAA
ncbi:MAG: UvrB/UvrC motif-containing protein, partial [Desulfovibrionaceae bacterium]|nr:UvrB/UvrC motif-containing protein [Desulfovibrionaceae bacterium]